MCCISDLLARALTGYVKLSSRACCAVEEMEELHAILGELLSKLPQPFVLSQPQPTYIQRQR